MKENNLIKNEKAILINARSAILIAVYFLSVLVIISGVIFGSQFVAHEKIVLQKPNDVNKPTIKSTSPLSDEINSWKAPDDSEIPSGKDGAEILYGKELIVHTAKYLGPKGSVAKLANGMNCQNCHNDAGTKAFALNFSAVYATYPQYKARSNSYVSIAQRINGCLQRSLNGTKLDTGSKEMSAIIAYMKWLGKDVAKGVKPINSGIKKLAFLDRAADPLKGKLVYLKSCSSCHAENGDGKLTDLGNEYIYPPLWGKNSYNDGAGLYRITNLAGFVKNNMPFGVNSEHQLLTDEQAWDVSAYVNSQPRPHKDQKGDWKIVSEKPIDLPFGPYADHFSEHQHKYGPFKEIELAKKQVKITKKLI